MPIKKPFLRTIGKLTIGASLFASVLGGNKLAHADKLQGTQGRDGQHMTQINSQSISDLRTDRFATWTRVTRVLDPDAKYSSEDALFILKTASFGHRTVRIDPNNYSTSRRDSKILGRLLAENFEEIDVDSFERLVFLDVDLDPILKKMAASKNHNLYNELFLRAYDIIKDKKEIGEIQKSLKVLYNFLSKIPNAKLRAIILKLVVEQLTKESPDFSIFVNYAHAFTKSEVNAVNLPLDKLTKSMVLAFYMVGRFAYPSKSHRDTLWNSAPEHIISLLYHANILSKEEYGFIDQLSYEGTDARPIY